MMPVMNFVGNLGYVTVCVVGALLALNGSITFGVIVAFMVYVRLFTSPLSQIAQALTSLQSASAAAGRVFEFLEAEEMEDESGKTKTLQNPTGQVTFSTSNSATPRAARLSRTSASTSSPARRSRLSGRPAPARRPLSTS